MHVQKFIQTQDITVGPPPARVRDQISLLKTWKWFRWWSLISLKSTSTRWSLTVFTLTKQTNLLQVVHSYLKCTSLHSTSREFVRISHLSQENRVHYGVTNSNSSIHKIEWLICHLSLNNAPLKDKRDKIQRIYLLALN